VQLPDMVISKDAKQIAWRMDGQMQLLKGRPASFVPQQWAYRSGEASLPTLKAGSDALRCDRVGCIAQHQNVKLAMVREQAALVKDCAQADIVIAPFIVWESECSHPLVIDRRMLQREGGIWLWQRKDGWEIGSTRQAQGRRPWSH